jgi:hypothetical protein
MTSANLEFPSGNHVSKLACTGIVHTGMYRPGPVRENVIDLPLGKSCVLTLAYVPV